MMSVHSKLLTMLNPLLISSEGIQMKAP